MQEPLNFNDARIREPRDLRLLSIRPHSNVKVKITVINETKVFDCYLSSTESIRNYRLPTELRERVVDTIIDGTHRDRRSRGNVHRTIMNTRPAPAGIIKGINR